MAHPPSWNYANPGRLAVQHGPNVALTLPDSICLHRAIATRASIHGKAEVAPKLGTF
ncbi:hypothetical protein ACQ4M4_00675 [Leptolyngbya sp. AN02str]|uniref:hypothetical protein n=1 Tax=Leptolyngbya sp. AN02str TaxID=3423363 RepID=UPI003D3186BE